jgi:LuxR family maltose regulon positive regulatory protein
MACGMLGDRRFFPLLNQALDLARRANNFYLSANILFNQAFGLATFMLQLHSAWQTYQKIIDLCTPAADRTQGYPAGVGLVGQAGIALEWNDIDTASRLLDQGLALCRQGGITTVDFYALLTQARLALARGDRPGTSAALAEAARNGSIVSQQMTAVQLIQAQVRLCLAGGQSDAAARWARGEELPVSPGLPALMQEIMGLAQAHVDLAQGRPKDALTRLERLVPQSESARRLAHVMEGRLLQALAQHALHQNALESLEHALSLSQPEGATRLILEAGPTLRGLLLAYRTRLGPLTAEADRLLALLGEPAAATLPEQHPPLAPTLVEPLTSRELDVLRLLYAGQSNREIASTLYLSLSAVKKYTGNIYGKLGVSSRAQAIAKARELQLV